MTETFTCRADQLAADHLGKKVLLESPGFSISGVLLYARHEVEILAHSNDGSVLVSQPETRVSIFRDGEWLSFTVHADTVVTVTQ